MHGACGFSHLFSDLRVLKSLGGANRFEVILWELDGACGFSHLPVVPLCVMVAGLCGRGVIPSST